MGARDQGRIHAGVRVGRLTVIERVEPTTTRGGLAVQRWLCSCACGNRPVVRHAALLGQTLSCGCWYRETRGANRTHGKSTSAEYSRNQRAFNPARVGTVRAILFGMNATKMTKAEATETCGDTLTIQDGDPHGVSRTNRIPCECDAKHEGQHKGLGFVWVTEPYRHGAGVTRRVVSWGEL